MPCFEVYQPAPPSSSPPVSESSFVTCHASKLTNLLLLPSSSWVLVHLLPCFEAHQAAPPSSSPPVGESSLVTCHVLKLTNPLLPPVVLFVIIIYAMLWVQWGGVSQCGWGKCQLVVFVNVLSSTIFA